jgi:hypothetical protein
MDVSFLLPCHFADHITQKQLVPLFSVSLESESAVRISDYTNTAVHLSEQERSFPSEIFPVVCGANLDPNLMYTVAETSCVSLTSI